MKTKFENRTLGEYITIKLKKTVMTERKLLPSLQEISGGFRQ